jgi:hypothetical protein
MLQMENMPPLAVLIVEILGNYGSTCNVPDFWIQGKFLTLIVSMSFGVFYLYTLLFYSLQYMYKDMYCSYISVVSRTLRDNQKFYLLSS